MAKQTAKKRTRPINLEDLGSRVDKEVEELVRWFNDDVVPSIRRHSSRTLRSAAVKLSKFADYMDDLKRRG